MRIRIEIDAGERQAQFVREPVGRTLAEDPAVVLDDHLVELFSEAREWLSRKPTPTEGADRG